MKALPTRSDKKRGECEGDDKGMKIPLFTIEAQIKRRMRAHLRRLGFIRVRGELRPPEQSKECYRHLHHAQRADLLKKEEPFVMEAISSLKSYFANGCEIDPSKIMPRLELVTGNTWQSDLFRLAALTWSIPVSHGYGRRLRFLVWDEYNSKLIGLIALGDPVFNLRVRDEFIGWTAVDRRQKLVNVMDAYVLGALPPYNFLLGGKLVACLIKTSEVKEAFSKKYEKTRGIISKLRKNPTLALVTTSSALGRSAVYNRLVLGGSRIFESIGYTRGWGHFHIPDDVFLLIRRYLKAKRHKYEKNHEFGHGPNWRLRAIRQALDSMGYNSDLLRHGISREVFICPIADNAREVLRGEAPAVYTQLLSIRQVAALARTRWIEPRAKRDERFRSWDRNHLIDSLCSSQALRVEPMLGKAIDAYENATL